MLQPFDVGIISCIRVFYLLSASIILLVRLIPDLRDRFLDYGARENHGSSKPASTTSIGRLVDYIATFKVPHSKFWHFYSLTSGSTIFWLSHIASGNYFFATTDPSTQSTTSNPSTSPAKIGLCFFLLWIQALRRFSECIKTPPSSSLMWIGHYIIGMAFYLVTNVAVFIEHVGLIRHLDKFTSLFLQVDRGPSFLESVAFVTFVVASKKQHDYHAYLAGLVKYTLPNEGAFKYIVAPHYTAECAIYLSLAVLTAPAGQYVNMTMLCASIFVVINLGVTSDGTKRWMLNKFPQDRSQVEGRWKMIPLLF